MDKEKFGIFSPVSGIKKNVPIILTLTPDNINVLLKDGKILRRKRNMIDNIAKTILKR